MQMTNHFLWDKQLKHRSLTSTVPAWGQGVGGGEATALIKLKGRLRRLESLVRG